MSRFLAACFLLVLLIDSFPLVPSWSRGCTMPCCRRSGKPACCPRLAGGSHDARTGARQGCRLVTCDPDSREGTRAPAHDRGIVAKGPELDPPRRPERPTVRQIFRLRAAYDDPLTPPPRTPLS